MSAPPTLPHLEGRFVVDTRYDPRRGPVWYLLHEYRRYVRLRPDLGVTVHAPYGFAWDSASVPPRLQGIIPRWGLHTPASLCHDLLYVTQEVDRRTADAVFYAALREDGVGVLKAWIMWFAVRVGGWRAWQT